MTSKEIVKRAVNFSNPPRTPILYFNRDLDRSDAFFVSYSDPEDFVPDVEGRSEWGFIWKTSDGTMGQPHFPPLEDGWELLSGYKLPNPDAPGRLNSARGIIEKNPDKYIIGNLGISGFNMITFIRGMENIFEDMFFERENLDILTDKVFGFESRMIEHYASIKADAVSFYDDWGTQNNLMVSPNQWREIFKEKYKKQFDLAHSLGLHVFFHSCGQIDLIIPDLIEIGVDILNLNQPDIFGIEYLGENYGGKVCFNCPVDHQTVAINGTRDEIFDYTKRLQKSLGTYNGGFIANIEEYKSVGMSEENYIAISEAFEALNK